MISVLHAMFRRHFCVSCRLQAYGHVNGMKEAPSGIATLLRARPASG